MSTLPPSLRLRQPAHAQPAQPANAASTNPNLSIKFRHPGYPDAFDQNILLDLHPFDHAAGGLQYGVAFLACAIVAGNSWMTGYLTETRAGSRLNYDWDHLLMGEQYYFWVPPVEDSDSASPQEPVSPAEAYKYPIFSSFQHWQFPHRDLPAEWPSQPSSPSGPDPAPTSVSGVTSYVTNRDEHCVISESKDYMSGPTSVLEKRLTGFNRMQ